MFNKLKKIFNTHEKKRLLSNFFSLSILQATNYILPLITVPYLVRVIGVEKFGLLAFATATVAYFNIIVDYGFNLTATREISIHREDKEKVSEIFSSVMTIKFILMLVSLAILTILVFSIDKFNKDYFIYFLSFGMVVGQMLFPVWLFQGMEQMKYITYLNVLARLIFTVAIFVFVKTQDDFYLVPFFNSVGFILAGVVSLVVTRVQFYISFKLQALDKIIILLRNGWYIFLSQLKISLFSNTNTVILGLISGDIAVGYYTAAEKVVRALAMLQAPITSSIFPHIAKKININKLGTLKFIKKIINLGTIIYLLILSMVFIFSDNIIDLIYTSRLLPYSSIVLKIILIIPLTIFLNNIFGTQIMLNTGRDKAFFWILFSAGMLNLVLCTLLTFLYSYIGTALSLLIVEVYIMFVMMYAVRKEFRVEN